MYVFESAKHFRAHLEKSDDGHRHAQHAQIRSCETSAILYKTRFSGRYLRDSSALVLVMVALFRRHTAWAHAVSSIPPLFLLMASTPPVSLFPLSPILSSFQTC